jgi:translation initiation factor IF-2
MFREAQAKERALGSKGGRLTLESLKEQIAEGGVKELPLIVKADVQGSAEVLADTLTKLSDEKVKIRIIRSGVGAINESDVLLASASNAIIIGFNVRPDRNAQDMAEREEVDIRLHSVIYNVTEEMQKAMAGMLEPTFKEVRSVRRKSARCSRCRRSARLPAAWSPTAASHAAARHRSVCSATTSSFTRARSRRCAASRTM